MKKRLLIRHSCITAGGCIYGAGMDVVGTSPYWLLLLAASSIFGAITLYVKEADTYASTSWKHVIFDDGYYSVGVAAVAYVLMWQLHRH